MSIYKIQDPKSGRIVTIEGATQPTESDLDEIFAKVNSDFKPQEPVKEEPKKGFLESIMTSKSAPTLGYNTDQDYGERNGKMGSWNDNAQAMFPRTSQNADKGIIKRSISGALDAASLPGRVIISTAKAIEKPNIESKFAKELSKTSVDENTPLSVGSFLEGVARDPVTPFTLGAGGVAKNAVATLGKQGLKQVLKKSALQGLKEGVASAAVHQTDNVVQDKDINGKEALTEVAISSLLPSVFKLGGTGVKKVAKGTESLVKKGISELTKVSEDAFENFATKEGKKAIIDQAGKQSEIGEDLIKKLKNFDAVLPNYREVTNVLQNLPPINKTDLIDNLISYRTPKVNFPDEKRLNEGLNSIIRNIDTNYSDKISAIEYKTILQGLDKELDSAFGKDSVSQLTGALKNVRHEMGQNLVNLAKSTGNTQYVDLMNDYSSKLQLRDQILGMLGKSENVQKRRGQGFIDTLFGQNKEERQQLISQLDQVFGNSKIYDNAQNARYAKELGVQAGKESPSIFSQHTTGKANLGSTSVAPILTAIAGGPLYNALGAVGIPIAAIPAIVGLASSSPRVGAKVYKSINQSKKATKKVGDLIKKAKLNPDQLVKYSRGTVADFLTKEEDKK